MEVKKHKFKYTVLKDGKEYTDFITAKDRFEVYSIIKSDGGEIINVIRTDNESRYSWESLNERFSTVGTIDLVIFTKNLSAMLSAGLSLIRSLEIIIKQTSNPKLKAIIIMMTSGIRKGNTFTEVLSKHESVFSSLFISMVHAGEESGNLAGSLKIISDRIMKNHKLKKKIKGAMIYPSVILTVMIGIAILMFVRVVPVLKKTFTDSGVELPSATKIVIAISDFLIKYTLISVIGIMIFIVLFIYFRKTIFWKRAFDKVVLKLPVIGNLIKEFSSAIFARTLSSLLSSGVNIVDSLEITKDVVGNIYHKSVIQKAIESVRTGGMISKIFEQESDLYPIMVGEMLSVGEETGQIDNMLADVASFYEDEVEQKTKDLSTIIEPILMVVIGVFVGFFSYAMIIPIYKLGDSI